jgi:hypothetical protein
MKRALIALPLLLAGCGLFARPAPKGPEDSLTRQCEQNADSDPSLHDLYAKYPNINPNSFPEIYRKARDAVIARCVQGIPNGAPRGGVEKLR